MAAAAAVVVAATAGHHTVGSLHPQEMGGGRSSTSEHTPLGWSTPADGARLPRDGRRRPQRPSAVMGGAHLAGGPWPAPIATDMRWHAAWLRGHRSPAVAVPASEAGKEKRGERARPMAVCGGPSRQVEGAREGKCPNSRFPPGRGVVQWDETPALSYRVSATAAPCEVSAALIGRGRGAVGAQPPRLFPRGSDAPSWGCHAGPSAPRGLLAASSAGALSDPGAAV